MLSKRNREQLRKVRPDIVLLDMTQSEYISSQLSNSELLTGAAKSCLGQVACQDLKQGILVERGGNPPDARHLAKHLELKNQYCTSTCSYGRQGLIWVKRKLSTPIFQRNRPLTCHLHSHHYPVCKSAWTNGQIHSYSHLGLAPSPFNQGLWLA